MTFDHQPLWVAVVRFPDKPVHLGLLQALAGMGYHTSNVHYGHTDVAAADLVLVDCRQLSTEQLAAIKEFQLVPPLVAVVAQNAEFPLEALTCFAEIVSDHELGSSIFDTRLRRLISRVQCPVSVDLAGSPELALIQLIISHTSDSACSRRSCWKNRSQSKVG